VSTRPSIRWSLSVPENDLIQLYRRYCLGGATKMRVQRYIYIYRPVKSKNDFHLILKLSSRFSTAVKGLVLIRKIICSKIEYESTVTSEEGQLQNLRAF
jgi:hypothetical protein